MATAIGLKRELGLSKNSSIMVLMNKSLPPRLLPTNTTPMQDRKLLLSMAIAIVTIIAVTKLETLLIALML